MVTVIGLEVADGDVHPVPLQLVNRYPAAGVTVTETGVNALNVVPETGENVPFPAGFVCKVNAKAGGAVTVIVAPALAGSTATLAAARFAAEGVLVNGITAPS